MDDPRRRSRLRSRSARSLAPALIGLSLAYGCSNFAGTTAVSFMNTIRRSDDPNQRYLAYSRLASPRCYDSDAQKLDAVKILSERLEAGKEPVASRAMICQTLGRLGLPDGRGAVLKAIDDTEPVVRIAACRALGKVGQAEDATVLTRIMAADSSKDCQIAAIEGLGDLKSHDPRIELALAQGMENEDPAIRLASVEALRSVSGQDLGIEPDPWKKYAQARLDRASSTPRPAVVSSAPPGDRSVLPATDSRAGTPR